VVVKHGWVSYENRLNLRTINEIFENGWLDSSILIVTNYTGKFKDTN